MSYRRAVGRWSLDFHFSHIRKQGSVHDKALNYESNFLVNCKVTPFVKSILSTLQQFKDEIDVFSSHHLEAG